MLDLYQVPDVSETVKLDHIVSGYYSIDRVKPSHIIRSPQVRLDAPAQSTRLGKALSAA